MANSSTKTWSRFKSRLRVRCQRGAITHTRLAQPGSSTAPPQKLAPIAAQQQPIAAQQQPMAAQQQPIALQHHPMAAQQQPMVVQQFSEAAISPPDSALPGSDDAEYFDFLMTFAGEPGAAPVPPAPTRPPPAAARPLTAEEADKYWTAHAGTRAKYLTPLQAYMAQVEQAYRNKPGQDVTKALTPLREVCRVLQAERATAPPPTRAEYEQLARVQKYIAKLLERRKVGPVFMCEAVRLQWVLSLHQWWWSCDVYMYNACVGLTCPLPPQQAQLNKQRSAASGGASSSTPNQVPTPRTSLPAPSPGQALSPLPPVATTPRTDPRTVAAPLFSTTDAAPSISSAQGVADPVRAITAALQRPRVQATSALGGRTVSLRLPPAPVGGAPAATAPTTIVLNQDAATTAAAASAAVPSAATAPPAPAVPAEHRAMIAREAATLSGAVVDQATGLLHVPCPSQAGNELWCPTLVVGLDVGGEVWQAGVPRHPPADDLSDLVSMATLQRDRVMEAMAARVAEQGGLGGMVDAWHDAWADVGGHDVMEVVQTVG